MARRSRIYPLLRRLLASTVAAGALSCAPPVARAAVMAPNHLALGSPLLFQQPDSESVAALVTAAHAIDLPGLTSGDAAALDAIGRVIGNARVVMLGEPWHGDGGAIRARGGLVRYLHEHLGFDVLAFEADFYSLNAGWSQARTPDAVRAFGRQNVFAFWSESRAAQSLWDYIATQRITSRPLEITGFDIRHTGRLARTALPRELRRLIAALPGTASVGVDTGAFFATLDRLLTREYHYKAPKTELDQFLTVLERLARALEERPTGTSRDDAFWAQEARNLAWAAGFAWGGRSRDRGMGENFAWLVAHLFSGRKTIIWAHNNHIIADHRMYLDAPDSTIRTSVARMSRAQQDSFMYFGDAVRRLFGKDAFTIATLSHEGTYSPVIDVRGYVDSATVARYITAFDSVRALPATPSGTLEAALVQRGFCAAFVDLRPFAGRRQAVRTRALDYTSLGPLAVRWWVGYDAFLFLRRTSGLNETAPGCWATP